MANRVFQNVVYQMKDAIDRVVGVVDETEPSSPAPSWGRSAKCGKALLLPA